MKYIAYENTPPEQYYDTKTQTISYIVTDKTVKCNSSDKPNLQAVDISGKKIWVKMTKSYYKIQELNAIIGLNKLMIVDYASYDKRFCNHLRAQNASLKAKIKKLK